MSSYDLLTIFDGINPGVYCRNGRCLLYWLLSTRQKKLMEEENKRNKRRKGENAGILSANIRQCDI